MIRRIGLDGQGRNGPAAEFHFAYFGQEFPFIEALITPISCVAGLSDPHGVAVKACG